MYDNLFRRYIFPAFEKGIKRRDTCSYLREYDEQQWWSFDKLQVLQLEKLKKLLSHAYYTVPYYTKMWKKIDFTPDDLKNISDLKELPVLTKETIKENYSDLISTSFKSSHLVKTTGGSTGSPLRFAYSQESFSRRNAIMWRGYTWAGLPPGKKSVYLWGTNVGKAPLKSIIKDNLYNRFYNRTMLSCFELNEATLNKYVIKLNKINKRKSCVIVSYVNPIYQFSKWLKENNKLKYFPEAIITGAEPLHEYQRNEIENTFQCKVFNTYGCREVMLIASECEKKSGMHINIDNLVVESVNRSGESVRNILGELVITDLHNYAMPFIRYKNEDLVVINDYKCDCGRGLPIMSKVEGRVLDCIKTVDGRILPGEYFPHFLKDFKGIEQFQVIQEKLTKLDIYLVTNDYFTELDKSMIKAELRKALGGDMVFEFHYVGEIPLTKLGKRRVTISNIKN